MKKLIIILSLLSVGAVAQLLRPEQASKTEFAAGVSNATLRVIVVSTNSYEFRVDQLKMRKASLEQQIEALQSELTKVNELLASASSLNVKGAKDEAK
jgi:hypothetical protein